MTEHDAATNERELTFGVYPDADGPFAVMNQERPDIPVGALATIQDRVDDAVDAGHLTVDEPLEQAGQVKYVPGKHDGSVVSVTINTGAQ
ncbi:hypothetical protein [Natronosalvus rutilus]|uniref:Uncharacterized protein n=1 Tax=Natronosalvus rutilus TaxID=2953753 RepID=A0A9E7NFH2_9EURY|nr:hypothetical protein [Natronosalvus rutilus]UTF56045.1 hypothetical protein NGM29_20880 [Natronosalvus rutilus]